MIRLRKWPIENATHLLRDLEHGICFEYTGSLMPSPIHDEDVVTLAMAIGAGWRNRKLIDVYGVRAWKQDYSVWTRAHFG